MGQMKKLLPAMVAAFGMMALILDAKTGLRGAAEGLEMCVSTVIPALFPFFVVSGMLTASLGPIPLLRPLGRWLKLPNGGETYLLLGFLGGYPVGARCIAQGYRAGVLGKEDGERMLSFCSNAGPAFLFGMGAWVFPKMWMCWLLWLIHILSALFVGLTAPAKSGSTDAVMPKRSVSVTETMKQAIAAMAAVCGWVITMKVVLAFLERWVLWLLPETARILLSGLLELTNGVYALREVSSLSVRFCLFSLFLSFGGISVLLQTHSVLAGSGLIGRQYFPGKVVQAAMSMLLSGIALPFLQGEAWMPDWWVFLPAAVIVGIRLFWSVNYKNNSGIFRRSHV